MEVYVVKCKKEIFKFRNHKYILVLNDSGYVTEEYFYSEEELYKRLTEKPLYRSKYFPWKLLSVRQFIDRGFSIYL